MESEDIIKLKKAGEIASKTIEYSKSIIKPETPLLEIAEKIESKIIELGGKPAFPVNLSINEVAAHSTPSPNNTEKAHGLLKVDLGVQIDGLTADTAFSLDLENSDENQKLIETAKKALDRGIKSISINMKTREIGKEIGKEISSANLQPVINLSGHSISQWELHSGITIPNTDNFSEQTLNEGIYAIEPFVTTGSGAVRDGKLSGIYHLESTGNVRDNFAREVLQFISEEYRTLPFCSRWIHKKFGSRGLLALRQLESAGCLHHYPQLIEKSGEKVAQAEKTIVLTDKEKIILIE